MAMLDIPGDARRAFDALSGGGIAIMPMDVGYTCSGGSAAALQKIFDTKGRTAEKRNAMIGDMEMHRELHVIDQRGRDVVQAVCEDHGLPFGPIAPCDMEHPILRNLESDAIPGSIKDNTVCMLVNAGPFHAEICRLSRENEFPIFGSSANKSLAGTKFRVEDIEPDIRGIADVIIDHGLRKYHPYRASSTLIDLRTLDVVRVGSSYELIADILKRYFDHELPPAPEDFLGGLMD